MNIPTWKEIKKPNLIDKRSVRFLKNRKQRERVVKLVNESRFSRYFSDITFTGLYHIYSKYNSLDLKPVGNQSELPKMEMHYFDY